jgi:hypothetical protein
MKKVALLIGVSEYADGRLQALPAAIADIAALKAVLQEPEIGGFEAANVIECINPDRQSMEAAIYQLFATAQKDDLVLLYFSGHGVVDRINNGEFYFASRIIQYEPDGRPNPTTAVAAKTVQGWMQNSPSKRQIVILDCCYAGAFIKGTQIKDDGVIDVRSQLGGEGRAIFTASTSMQYAFTQEEFELSTYTHYLVEGLGRGGADLDDDGWITVDELHDYVKAKVNEAAPTMRPDFYQAIQSERMVLAKSPISDPQLRYRKRVRQFALEDEGEIDFINRCDLDEFQQQLGLTAETALQIETEELEPYRQRQHKLSRYRQVFEGAVRRRFPLSEGDRFKLKRFQIERLNLRDEDVEAIERYILAEHEDIARGVADSQESRVNEDVDQLISEKGIDYTRLRDLLKAGKWKEADQETAEIMLRAVGRQSNDWMRPEELRNFPCADLQTIDKLWVKYSQGKFGFSVQKQIYVACGAQLDGNYPGDKIWHKFCDQLGWLVKEDYVNYFNLKFDPSLSLPGELPARLVGGWRVWGVWVWWGVGGSFSSLAWKLVKCNAIRSVEMSSNTQG